MSTPVFAGRPVLAIAPCAHAVPNVRQGLAAQLYRELLGSGRYELADNGVVEQLLEDGGYAEADGQLSPEYLDVVSEEADYLLLCRVTAFDVVDRDALGEVNSDLRDLGTLILGQDKAAYVAFDVSLYETGSGLEVSRFAVEGIESKRGVRLKALSLGWQGSVDFDSDEFRRANIGIATYKAIGELMRELYAKFPLRGSVLAVSGDALVLDLDERAGLLLGDELSVVRKQVITNVAGEPVWEDETRVGSCRVVEFQPGRCLCLVLDGFGAIQEGDRVIPVYESITVPREADKAE